MRPLFSKSGTQNSLRGDGYYGLDAGLSKLFLVTERVRLRLRWDAFNVTNSVRFDVRSLGGTFLMPANFGVYSSTLTTPRVMQVALRVSSDAFRRLLKGIVGAAHTKRLVWIVVLVVGRYYALSLAKEALFMKFIFRSHGTNRTFAVFLVGAAMAVASHAQTFTTLGNFNGNNGLNPDAGLEQGVDGNFYGITPLGGVYYKGAVFKITPGGTLTTLHSFSSTPVVGAGPAAKLIQATDGYLYGTTYGGGANGFGTVFKITRGGALTTLHSFDQTDGANLLGGLIQATNGNLLGTTFDGGEYGEGTVFEITPGGAFTSLLSFNLNASGAHPAGALVQALDGNFYGTTTMGGGISDCGTIFKVTPGGAGTTLHKFVLASGCSSEALIQATDGNFYGTSKGCVTCTGLVFEITPAGMLTTLHTFTSGEIAGSALLQATNGDFYGTTVNGGTSVFSLSVGLSPFVTTLPTSGRVGTAITILGTNLTGATSVSFNGIPAAFTVVSVSEITTTIPTGAITGELQVTTPAGNLLSNVAFRVTPVISSFSPTSGPTGTVVVITGESLTGAESVTFNGVKATSYTVNSDTLITATVPVGATTGHLYVITPAAAPRPAPARSQSIEPSST